MTLALVLALVAGQANFGSGSPAVPSRGDALRVRQYQTTAALNLFVDPAGSDANSCTSSSTACLTLQSARSRIPARVRHPVVVTLAAGNYAGAYFSGFSFDPADVANGAYIQITGPLANVTPATGSATGTATAGSAGSGTTYGTLTNGAATWTINDLRGKFISITGGTGSGQLKVIASNTATVITIVGTWTAPTGTSTYAVVEPTAVFTTSVQLPPVPGTAAATGAALVFSGSINKIHANSTTGVFDVQQVKLAPATGDGILILGPLRVHTKLVAINTGTAVTRAIFVDGGDSSSEEVFINASASSAIGVSSFTAGSVGAGLIRLTNSLVRGPAGASSGNGVMVGGEFGLALSSVQIENFGFIGISILGSMVTTATSNVRIDCSSIAGSSGIAMSASASSLGTAPVGMFGSVYDISNCALAAISLSGPGKYLNMSGAWTGTGNTVGVSVSNGSKVQYSATSTLTGTTELSIDGTAYTIAAMRAAAPKIILDAAYGSAVYE